MQETCLICEGSGKRQGAACAYCAGQGRVKVRREAPQTVLMATGSCKVPVRRVLVDGGLSVPRLHSLQP